ncbi:citrate/2-methylcitrate synthase [Vreelandella gomseomensis]|uniref:Citrate synthase n=1 Tax=Vreelandella gomseomensis TaxID=370766 RepID=A0ABU1GEF5_9GAMM|nr:citrate/2-methylcitrate synthase [Halomonas gomseomensis]MDR5875483.1 citrate/2-methylcitrate synthase [Halomonas gomseomensis]
MRSDIVKSISDAMYKDVSRGLKDVVLDFSEICEIDNNENKLRYRGYDVIELASSCNFECTISLLLDGELPSEHQYPRIEELLDQKRVLSDSVVSVIDALPLASQPMDVLRTSVSTIGCSISDDDLISIREQADQLIAQMPLIIGYLKARRDGGIAPKYCPGFSHAANVLSQFTGTELSDLDPKDIEIMDQVLTIHAEHELNASCFSARVTASAITDLVAAVTSAISTLAGSLHGGANEKVLEAVEEIATPEGAEEYIDSALREKRKVHGFGQRGCKAEDPRAIQLRLLAEQVSKGRGGSKILPILYSMNEAMRQHRNLWPNVDFYSVSVLHDIGIEKDLFTPLFACSRVVGWSAHVLEQLSDNLIIRPKAKYVGHAYRPIPL